MAEKDSWKLQFDPTKQDVVLPPAKLKRAYRTVGDGPNAQLIEHCHFADTVENLHFRAPIFHMRVPLCDKGHSREWPMGSWPKCEVGQHLKIKLPVAIIGSERKSDNQFSFVGKIRITSPGELGRWLYIDIHNYSVSSREGSISMPRDSYVEIVNLWQHHFFETS